MCFKLINPPPSQGDAVRIDIDARNKAERIDLHLHVFSSNIVGVPWSGASSDYRKSAVKLTLSKCHWS